MEPALLKIKQLEARAKRFAGARIRRNLLLQRERCRVLNEEQVREIKRDLADGYSATSIARRYSVSETTIRDIRRGVTWGWVECSN